MKMMATMTNCLSVPAPCWLPRRRYTENGQTRLLLEFSPDPAWPHRRCAYCGCRDQSDEFLFGTFGEPMRCHRVFPGPRFVTDGFVVACPDCWEVVVDDHAEATDWPGIAVLRPVRGCPIEIARFGYADDARVAAAVEHVWNAAPRPDRRRILRYLEADNRGPVDDQPQVAVGRLRVETVPQWYVWGRNVLGENMAQGHVIRLWATAVREMDGAALAALAAHELAHSLQYATGTMPVEQDAASREQVEADARAIAGLWGFDDAAMHGWTR